MASVPQFDLPTLAKVAALFSSGIFAGYTYGLSRAGVPALLDYGPQSDEVNLPKWRAIYVDGAIVSRVCCVVSLVSFGFLATKAPAGSLQRGLYIVASVLGATGAPYALTLLRRTNGALCIRAKRTVGPFGDGPQPIAITFALNEARSIEREKNLEWTTRRLIQRWKWHNDIRTVGLFVGVVAGALAVSMA